MSNLGETTPAVTEQSLYGERRPRKIPKIAIFVLLVFLLVAAVLGGVFGGQRAAETRRKRKQNGPKAYDSSTIVDALQSANKMQPNVNGTFTNPSSIGITGTAAAGPTAPAGEAATANPIQAPLQVIKSIFYGNNIKPSQKTITTGDNSENLPIGTVVTNTWKAATRAGASGAAAGRSIICYPKNGTEIVQMVGPLSPCNVLVLRKGRQDEYMIRQTMNVSTPKVIIGNPLNLPVLNCTNRIERLWNILPGGRIDARFVVMVRGFGRRTGTDREIRLHVGTLALIQVGGYFTASGCFFRERPNTAETWRDEIELTLTEPRTRSRNFGQLFLVVGGSIRFTGCRFFRLRPYGNGLFIHLTIGRDVLVVAGNGVMIGCLTYGANLYASNPWVSGNLMAVLGGTGLLIGGIMVGATGAQLQIGYGCQLLVAAGMLVTIGWGYVSTNCALGRVNGGQFAVGAGGLIMVGFYQGRAWGVGAVFGPGQSYACSSGLYYKINSAFASFAIATIFCGVGGSLWIGSGSMKYIEVARTSISTAATTYGAGSTIFNGGGGLSLIYFEQFSANVARWMAGAGSDWFLGGGWATSVNHTRYGANVVNAFTGAGGQAFVGLGAAVFIRSYSQSWRTKNWNTNPNTYTVAGTGTRKTRGNNIYMDKTGVFEFIYNKSTKEITKWSSGRTQKTPHPTKMPNSTKKASVPKRTKVRRHRKGTTLEEEQDPEPSWLTHAVDAMNDYPFNVPNKVVALQSTIMEVEGLPPHPSQFRPKEFKNRYGGYPKLLADGLVDTDADGMTRKIIPGKISAKNSECFLCSVKPGATADHIGGPAECEVNDLCEGESNMDIYDAAQARTDKDLSFPQTAFMPTKDESGKLKNSDVWLIWHELTAYCKSTATDMGTNCLEASYLKKVVLAFIGEDLSKLAEVAVSAVAVDGTVQPILRGTDEGEMLQSALSPEWDQECQGWAKYNVYITTTFQDVEDALLEIWDEILRDPTPFSTAVVDNAVHGQGIDEPCYVTVKRKAAVKYPSMDHMPAYKPSSTTVAEGVIAPTLTIGSATAIVPVEKLFMEKDYTIFVQNFPQNSPINIVLVNASADNATNIWNIGYKLDVKGGEAYPVVAAIDSFNDDDGVEEVVWTVPNEPGRYYLHAFPTNVPALFADSPVFTIVDENDGNYHEEHVGQRRRHF